TSSPSGSVDLEAERRTSGSVDVWVATVCFNKSDCATSRLTILEKIDETRPLRWPDADLQPLWPKLRIRTAHDDIDANHKNSGNRNDQSRCRSGQSVWDPAERSSRHR